MKNLIVFLIFLLPLFSQAQKTHTVGAKESLYSIGRMYNVHPRELASYNNLSINDGLNIGQVIKIPGKTSMEPLNDNPPASTPAKAVEQPKVAAQPTPVKGNNPVYHTVEAKEGLYSISKKHNVSIAQIKQWNNLDSDNIDIGMDLVVGYNGTAKRETEKPATPPTPVADKPTSPQKQETVVAKESKTTPAPVATKKEPVSETKAQGVRNPIATGTRGDFKPSYDVQVAGHPVNQETGVSGVFKSTSGWEDGKYYCLHNSAPTGSIIKVTNNATQKIIYAKVLDLIPDLRQNNALIIRISNAGAAALGVDGTEFNCTLNY